VRIEPLEREDAVGAARAVGFPEDRITANIFRTLLKHGNAANLVNVGTSYLLNGPLDFRLQELVIMRVAWVTGCRYVWAQHYRRSRHPEMPGLLTLGNQIVLRKRAQESQRRILWP
jgi:alkylhydroperoxidase family enzyme